MCCSNILSSQSINILRKYIIYIILHQRTKNQTVYSFENIQVWNIWNKIRYISVKTIIVSYNI